MERFAISACSILLLAACGAGDTAPTGAPAATAATQPKTGGSTRPEPVKSTARDPGPRAGLAGAGAPLTGLTVNEILAFNIGKEDFGEEEGVADGLGPRMNLDGCGGCHSQPAIGGTSPALNPQVAFASKESATNVVPSFLSLGGPIREARFVAKPDGSPDGGVQALFTITGRSDATPDCHIAQPDFAAAVAAHNVIFRIPTPVFGAGLMEQIPDRAILANQASHAQAKQKLGIRGHANRSAPPQGVSGLGNSNGNDGTISRFGWKAQNKSMLLFSGEAYNVEMGISNDLFQTERDETDACQYVATPNSVTDLAAATLQEGLSSIEKFANFMRFLAAPVPSTDSPGGAASIASGKALFTDVGCALCHTPTLRTGQATVVALGNQDVNLFSDLLVHDMGEGLADGITQGTATGREFRTAPLWGLGQRLFFLHDGRTSDLQAAVQQHASSGSEANATVSRFNALSDAEEQDLLNFLRSL